MYPWNVQSKSTSVSRSQSPLRTKLLYFVRWHMRTSAQHPSNSQDGGPWEVIQFPRFERQKVFYFYFSNLKSKDKSKVRKQRTRRSARLVLVAEVLKIVLGFKKSTEQVIRNLLIQELGIWKPWLYMKLKTPSILSLFSFMMSAWNLTIYGLLRAPR